MSDSPRPPASPESVAALEETPDLETMNNTGWEDELPTALPSPVPETLSEALTAYAVAVRTSSLAHPLLEEHAVQVVAARSRLESIYREQQEEIEGLVRVKDGYFEELVRVRAALSSLKDEQLTPEEAEKILTLIEGNVPLFEAELPVMEKLRALSTKPEINK